MWTFHVNDTWVKFWWKLFILKVLVYSWFNYCCQVLRFQATRGRGVLGLILAGYVPLASQSIYPITVYFVANNKPHFSHFWAKVIFLIPPQSLSIYVSTLYWMKNTLLSTFSTNILLCLLTVNLKNFFTPKNPKRCDPVLVTPLKMQPHYSHPDVKMWPHPVAHPH